MDALSRLGLANVVDREVGEMIPAAEARRGELGEIDRFRIVTSGPRTPSLGDAEWYARQQAAERQRRATSWQQLRQYIR